MQSGIDTLNENQLPTERGGPRTEWNAWIEIALLWIAVILMIACWK